MSRYVAFGAARVLAIAGICAVAALALAGTTAAQAAPHWLADGKQVVGSMKLTKTKSDLTFTFGTTVQIECVVLVKGTIANPASGEAGTDGLTQFFGKLCEEIPLTTTEPFPCEGLEAHFNAVNTPWPSHLELEGSGPGVRDVIEQVALEVRCTKSGAKGGKGGVVLGIYTGTLEARVGNSVLEYLPGPGLSGPDGPLTISGSQPLKGKGKAKVITVG